MSCIFNIYIYVVFINQGLNCICEKNSKITNNVLGFPFCEPCPPNTTVTLDRMHCLKKINITCGSKDIECRL